MKEKNHKLRYACTAQYLVSEYVVYGGNVICKL